MAAGPVAVDDVELIDWWGAKLSFEQAGTLAQLQEELYQLRAQHSSAQAAARAGADGPSKP